ncbi:glycosyltransferase [Maridesulfovibrio sp. FT414]|uniref:glycosyltransferase n=1 Tax=Maridesulfovibrio sp. FT414 TaxID=2979469 RepID=UPI003D808987
MRKTLIIGNIAGAGYRIKKSLHKAGMDVDILISDNDMSTTNDPSWEDTAAFNGREFRTFTNALNITEDNLLYRNKILRQLYLYPKIRSYIKNGCYSFGMPMGIWPIIFHDLRIPYVWLCAGSDVREVLGGSSVLSRLMQNAMKSCLGVVTPADDGMLKILRKYIPEDRMLFIPNYPIDAEIYTNDDRIPSPFRIYHPSRHLWYGLETSVSKANNCLIEAVARLREQYDLRLEMAEWGKHLTQSKELIKKLGLEEVTEWHGLIDKRQMANKYQKSSCVVDHVGWGMVSQTSMEGLSCGKPVLANMSSSVFRQFPDIPIMNVYNTESCYQALHSLAADQLLYDTKRKESHAWVRDNWSVQVMGKKISAFFGLD